jgi:hypothetical protein
VGVLRKIVLKQPRNPNKWGKTLAPWYTDECRDAKRELATAKRNFSKGDDRIVEATRKYYKVCI